MCITQNYGRRKSKNFRETFNNVNELSIVYLKIFKDMQITLKKTCTCTRVAQDDIRLT